MARRSASDWDDLSLRQEARYVRHLGGGDAVLARRRYIRGDALGVARGHAERGEHRARVARGIDRGLTPSQAAGRPQPGEISASQIGREFFDIPVREGGGTLLVDIRPGNARQASQLGGFLADLGNTSAGRMSADEFAEKWRGRRIAGYPVEFDAGRAVEAARRAGPPEGGTRYRRIQPGRRAAA
jgi:hypothetical protein